MGDTRRLCPLYHVHLPRRLHDSSTSSSSLLSVDATHDKSTVLVSNQTERQSNHRRFPSLSVKCARMRTYACSFKAFWRIYRGDRARYAGLREQAENVGALPPPCAFISFQFRFILLSFRSFSFFPPLSVYVWGTYHTSMGCEAYQSEQASDARSLPHLRPTFNVPMTTAEPI